MENHRGRGNGQFLPGHPSSVNVARGNNHGLIAGKGFDGFKGRFHPTQDHFTNQDPETANRMPDVGIGQNRLVMIARPDPLEPDAKPICERLEVIVGHQGYLVTAFHEFTSERGKGMHIPGCPQRYQ